MLWPKFFRPLTNYPLASREERHHPSRHGTADIGEQGNGGYGHTHRQQRLGRVAGYNGRCDGCQEKQVHEVHAKREAGEAAYQLGSTLLADAGEEQEA